MSYTKPTKSTTLYEFTNREQDLIRQAFNSKNFTYIAKLPAVISPSRVSEVYKRNSIDNCNSRFSSVPRKGFEFKWMPDEYELAREKTNLDWESSKKKQQRISPTVFKNAGTGKKLKYEDLDGGRFEYAEDFFDSVNQQVTRVRWLKAAKFVNKEFKSPVKNDYYVSRGKAKEILNSVRMKLEQDWPELTILVAYSPTGAIETTFSGELNPKALHSYMNVFHSTQQFLLKKDMNQWGAEIGTSIHYNFYPPWIHISTPSVYSSLFPHSTSISTSRTGKNVPNSPKSSLFTSII